MNSILSTLAAVAPHIPQPGEILEGLFVGSGLVSINGCKSDLPLHSADRDSDLRTGPVYIVRVGKEDESDPCADEGDGLTASFVMARDFNLLLAAEASKQPVTAVPVRRLQLKGGVFGGFKVRFGTLKGILSARSLRGFAGGTELLNQEVRLDVLKVDPSTGRIEFGLHAATEARQARFEGAAVGEFVTGKVAKLLDFGVLVDIGDGACGLLHRSEMVRGAQFKPGAGVDVVVIGKNVESRRIALSQRKAVRQAFARDVVVGTEYGGTVISSKPYGVFVEIAPGVAGLLHGSRVPGFRGVESLPTPLRVKVLKTDAQGERIDLGLA